MQENSFITRILQNPYFKIIEAGTGFQLALPTIFENINEDFSGKLAFLYLDNSLSSIEAFFGFLSTNVAMVLLPKQMNLPQKNELENNYQPQIIFDNSREKIPTGIKKSIGNIHYISFETETKVHPEIKILLSTSGSTGSPKLVKLSEKNLMSNAVSITKYLPIQNSDITPFTLPIYYSYGLSVVTSHALSGGTCVCNLADVVQPLFWQQFDEFKFTSMAGVPFVYEMLERTGFFAKPLPSLRYATQAGGKLSEKLARKAAEYSKEFGKQFFMMYGQTEATARMAFLPPEKLQDKISSIGKAIPGGKLYIENQTNELVYEGENVFGGYAENATDLLSFEQQNILKTGDIATQDEEGFFYIIGRTKRFVKLFGNRINLDEIESKLKTEFALLPCAANGLADKFLLISYTQNNVEEKNISQFLFKEFAIHPSIIRWNKLSALPLTANGKIAYPQIASDYEQQHSL